MKEQSEKIICAAVWYKNFKLKEEIPHNSFAPKNIDTGIVICGHRHHNCFYTMIVITGLTDMEIENQSGEIIQGFLTSKNRFVDRTEALEIALRENQVIDLNEVRGDRLFSEDLY
jgi:hypothetical protein